MLSLSALQKQTTAYPGEWIGVGKAVIAGLIAGLMAKKYFDYEILLEDVKIQKDTAEIDFL